MRREKYVNVLLVFLILVVLNFISSRLFVRADLSSGKLYTLSRSSKEAVRNLDDLLIIKVFFSKKLPPNLLPLREQLSDLLEEYRAASRGKVRVEFIDPQKDKETESMVMRLGIPPVQMNVLARNKLEVVKGYLGVALFYGDKNEIIPVLNRADNIEYELTSRILKLVEGGERKVGFVLSGDDHSFDEDYSEVRDEMSKQYQVVEVKDSVPLDLDLLVVAGVSKLDEAMKKEIDSYIMKGGRVIFLADGIEVGENLQAHPAPREPLKFLESYGVRVKRDLVMDVSNEIAPFSSGYIRFFVPYPCWVKVRKENLSRTNPIVRDLSSPVFPWPSSLEFVGDSSLSVDTLVMTTHRSWTQEGYITLNPEMLPKPKPGGTEKRVLAVLLKGNFKSAFSDSTSEDTLLSPETAVLVVGNSKFLEDGFVRNYEENLAFFMNAVDYLGFGEKLISIRSKLAVERPIKPVSDTAKTLFKLFNTFGMAVVVVVFGLVRYYIRRREKEAF